LIVEICRGAPPGAPFAFAEEFAECSDGAITSFLIDNDGAAGTGCGKTGAGES